LTKKNGGAGRGPANEKARREGKAWSGGALTASWGKNPPGTKGW